MCVYIYISYIFIYFSKNYGEEMPERCKKSAKSRKTLQFLTGALPAIPPRRDNSRGAGVLQDKARTFQLTVSILPPVQDKRRLKKLSSCEFPLTRGLIHFDTRNIHKS